MKSKDIKSRLLLAIVTLCLLAGGYWLCRYALFDWHGMEQWPLILVIVGAVVLVVAAISQARMLSLITVIGYIGGFFIGTIFQSYGTDPGGGMTNNLWLIWTAVFLICIVVGIVSDVLCNRIRVKIRSKS